MTQLITNLIYLMQTFESRFQKMPNSLKKAIQRECPNIADHIVLVDNETTTSHDTWNRVAPEIGLNDQKSWDESFEGVTRNGGFVAKGTNGCRIIVSTKTPKQYINHEYIHYFLKVCRGERLQEILDTFRRDFRQQYDTWRRKPIRGGAEEMLVRIINGDWYYHPVKVPDLRENKLYLTRREHTGFKKCRDKMCQLIIN